MAADPAAALRAPSTLAAAWLIARKDLRVELRTRTAFVSALVISLLGIVIFNYAWDPTVVAGVDLAPGVLWMVFTFAGLLGLHRSFDLEMADRAVDALYGAPIEREAVFLGKALANLVFVLAVQAVAIPAVALFYNLSLGGEAWLALMGVAVLAAIGLVAVGTLFSAMTTNTRLAELLLPVLTLPFFVPIVAGAAQTTARLLAGRPAAEAAGWLQLLVGFDVVFLTACTLAFPYLAEE